MWTHRSWKFVTCSVTAKCAGSFKKKEKRINGKEGCSPSTNYSKIHRQGGLIFLCCFFSIAVNFDNKISAFMRKRILSEVIVKMRSNILASNCINKTVLNMYPGKNSSIILFAATKNDFVFIRIIHKMIYRCTDCR